MFKIKFFNPILGGMLMVFILLFPAACKKDTSASEEKASITSFVFAKKKNPSLIYDITAEIRDDTIFAHTLAGTDVSKLIPDFIYEGIAVKVHNAVQTSGVDKHDFSKQIKYEVITNNGQAQTYIVKLDDTGLPALYISTNGKEISSKEDYVDGYMKIISGLDGNILYEGDLEIRGRGNSTWEMPKKPFRIKLVKKESLLGMPTNRNWALMANYGDKSLMRGDVAFELSRRLNLEYTPRQRYTEVFLNGEYMGNYNLTEHVMEGKDRIPIDEEEGGYILEADGYARQEPVYFTTPRGMPITVKFPDDDDITPNQLAYITNYYTSFEKQLFSETFDDPVEGYQQYFDMETFVNYYLVNEICGNPDMFWSMRMYKKNSQDPKIYTGPVWDFDLGFNNDNRLGNAVKKMMLTDAHEPRQWIARFAQDVNFKKAVRTRWNAIKVDSIYTINDYIDQQSKRLSHSQALNFARWDILSDPHIHLNWYVADSYEAYVEFLKKYVDERLYWLDQVINSEEFIN